MMAVLDDSELRSKLRDRLVGSVVEDDPAIRLPRSPRKVNTAVAGRGSRSGGCVLHVGILNRVKMNHHRHESDDAALSDIANQECIAADDTG